MAEQQNPQIEIAPNARPWWQQPLLHFIVLGSMLFGATQWLSSRPQQDDRTIVVDRDALLEFMQYRARTFRPDQADSVLSQMSPDDLDRLVEDYVRQEVLYREAIALGLDRNDYMARQRLIQKLEFLNRDLSVEITQLSDAEVRSYFEEHRDTYYDPPHVTFTHVFFNRETHGDAESRHLADRALTQLNDQQVPFHKGARHGDRFYYHVNYVERGRPEVLSHLGPLVTEAVFQLEPSEQSWYGPYESEYGWHVIMLSERVEGRSLALADVYDQVASDAKRAMVEERSKAIIDGIIDTYDVQIDIPVPADTKAGAVTAESESAGP